MTETATVYRARRPLDAEDRADLAREQLSEQINAGTVAALRDALLVAGKTRDAGMLGAIVAGYAEDQVSAAIRQRPYDDSREGLLLPAGRRVRRC
ncbi:hypothetical protein [uncultured Thiodictyon sp.]|uniref:hypothetical protein n=1 Tax=uncultured Thiodictyon sp. TaxID=1846217 RepID=UPI0025DC7ACB|nr:hypothetical protein [uncultured Thiodictyon sp.]